MRCVDSPATLDRCQMRVVDTGKVAMVQAAPPVDEEIVALADVPVT